MKTDVIACCVGLCGLWISAFTLPPAVMAQNKTTLPLVEPEAAGLRADRLDRIESLVMEGIAEGKMPGCVVCVGRSGKIGYLEAFGNKQVEPEPRAMTVDTVFDMASITKPVATATSIMHLLEAGHLRLGDKAVTFLPGFGVRGKEEITIQDLLIHQSGLIPDNALKDYLDGPQVAWTKICNLGLVAPVGTTFKYSDVNFIVLAKIVEQLSGLDVHEYSQQHVFGPLGMQETGYLPAPELRQRAAPTEQRDGQWMQGEVHDPRAYALGGIAGHAGLFSTAQDLAVYAQMLLDGGQLTVGDQQVRILARQTVQRMTEDFRVSSGLRGLGWDKQSPYSSNRGDLLSPSAFGHGGFTGTVLWVDPELDLFFIFLSNRVHPDGKGSVNHLAGRILNVVASAIEPPAVSTGEVSSVLTGIDVLRRDGYRQVAGQAVGLITNHTGRAADGQSTVSLLHEAPQVSLVALFSPEHGFEGQLDIARVDDSQDQTTGLKIFSLYGQTRKPTAEMLAGVDTLVFDIQDIGARFYTYVSTMGEAMRAAAEHGKRFVVLDRPNPIGGLQVTGPMLDAGKESFVGYHRLPVRHGMTTGELARLLKDELELDLELDVVACQGWQREQWWDATGLTWINPSPNMRCLTQALLYPGVGLWEMTNISVGRGTDTPFEIVGAPWMDGRALSRSLHARQLPGVSFVPIEFTPESSKHAGELCSGVRIIVTDRSQLSSVRLGIELAAALRDLHREQWDTGQLNRLLGNDAVAESLLSGASPEETWELSQRELRGFVRRRAQFLLYR